MRRKVPIILIFLLFAVGVVILLYPLISEWHNSRAQTTVIENYNHAVVGLNPDEAGAMREAARAYNEGLLGSVVLTDPFDAGAAERASEEYEALLNIGGDGVMGTVRIPKISVELPIYHGTATETLEKGAGIWRIPRCPSAAREPMRYCPRTVACLPRRCSPILLSLRKEICSFWTCWTKRWPTVWIR